jgi:hypothetical protein
MPKAERIAHAQAFQADLNVPMVCVCQALGACYPTTHGSTGAGPSRVDLTCLDTQANHYAFTIMFHSHQSSNDHVLGTEMLSQ